MPEFIQPHVVVSKCLGFEHCRWNGEIIADEFVARLRPHVRFQTVCAEVEIGLGVPRDPIRIVEVNGELRLLQPATGLDVTERMRGFARTFLDSLEGVDGFILKNRSPSCGFGDVKVYTGVKKGGAITKGAGFFGGAVLERFGHLAVEDEGRLKNYRIREHFMTKLFALARFRELKRAGAMRDLVQFHAENKMLLMAYSQKELGALGRIVANPEKKPLRDVLADYEPHLLAALAHPPRCTGNINVLMHALGYFSEGLSGAEKAFFLDMLQKYREGKAPVSTPRSLIQSWIVRFGEDYLAQQTFFAPYPEELLDLSDSGKQTACTE